MRCGKRDVTSTIAVRAIPHLILTQTGVLAHSYPARPRRSVRASVANGVRPSGPMRFAAHLLCRRGGSVMVVGETRRIEEEP